METTYSLKQDILYRPRSERAREELNQMGLFPSDWSSSSPGKGLLKSAGRPLIPKRAIHAPEILNEAIDYPSKTSFSRGLRIELPGYSMLYLSGTASVDDAGCSLYEGDFEAQCWRTYRNLTHLLAAEEASWHDIVRTTCYLKDMERDYDQFNVIRTAFMEMLELDPLPASTGIQATLCRPELLVEIEAIAIIPQPS